MKLGVDEDARGRKDLAQKQRLTPAAVRNNDVGHELLLGAQLRAGTCDGGAPFRHLVIGLADSLGCGRFGPAIVDDRHRRLSLVALDRQRHHAVSARLQRGGEVQELAGKVLVQEQDVHARAPAPGASPNAAAISSRVSAEDGAANTSSPVSASTTSPAFMTITLCASARTTRRSWLMNR